MTRYFISVIFTWIPLLVFGQTVQERIILTDTKDSLLLKANSMNFDKNGNYCFEIKMAQKYFLYTNSHTFGPFKFIYNTYGSNGTISYTESYPDGKDLSWNYKNANGTKVLGHAKGNLKHFITSHTKENIAITTTYRDSVYYFLNEKLVSQIQKDRTDKFGEDNDDWCAFSENGNSIYYIKQGSLFSIFVNERLIGRSPEPFRELSINDNGQYIYAEGRKPKLKQGKYDYMFFTHSIDTVIGPVRTVWHHDLKENGGYYYAGDDNGPDYITINNTLIKNIDSVANITIIDKTNYLFSYTQNRLPKVNVNGNTFKHDFSEIYCPAMDDKGNFAFYGLKNYFIHKYINGQEILNPITKFGVRPIPLYISPSGQSLHCFKTDDSVYLYRDNQLLHAVARRTNFKLLPSSEILPDNLTRNKANDATNLFYLEIDTIGYFVFNGQFSKPIKAAIKTTYDGTKLVGEIVAGVANANGFFIIQKIGENKFLIDINNRIYKEIEGMQSILTDSCYFDGKDLIFYGFKGLSFYQYSLTQ